MKGFPTRAPAELEDRAHEQQWLVDGLWARQAVGIVGGEPKCGKSFLALELAVAVAAGVPCLRRFTTAQPGPVLMFAAEDAGHVVRTRLAGIARAAGAAFDTLDIAVIDVPTLRLDHRLDRQRLLETVERIGPRLLVLDPLVRLHGVDENTVAEVAPTFGLGPRCVWRRPGRRTRPWARGVHPLHRFGEVRGAARTCDGQEPQGRRDRVGGWMERCTGAREEVECHAGAGCGGDAGGRSRQA